MSGVRVADLREGDFLSKSPANSDKYATAYKNIQRKVDLMAQGKVDIIAGHWSYGLHKYLPPDSNYSYFTVLREPTDRLESLYYYHNRPATSRYPPCTPKILSNMRKKCKPKDKGLWEFVTRECETNRMTLTLAGLSVVDERYFADMGPVNAGRPGPYPNVTEDIYELAIENLKKIDFVMTTRDIDSRMNEFTKWLKSKGVDFSRAKGRFRTVVAHTNKNMFHTRGKKLTAEQKLELGSLNDYDRRLFKYVSKKRKG